jgi:UDP-N-acetylglucosamine 2-epimerase (non-hydrolysing)
MHKLIRLLDEGQKEHNYEHIYVHSGQHFDYELDAVFYKELGVRKPDINLNIGKTLRKQGKTTQAYQSALLFEKVDGLVKKLKPDAVMYLGDTNTVTSSLIVAKNNIPVIHIEGGGRSYDWRMPEEKNRIVIDHLSDAIYCYLKRYKEILLAEGIENFRIKVVGNIIVDAIREFLKRAEKREILKKLGIKEKNFVLVTLHREENTSDKKILKNKLIDLLKFSKNYRMPIIFPLMPRTKEAIKKFNLKSILRNSNFITTQPLGFLDFLKLEKTAKLVVSDSGTVQEETLILGTPCVVARRSTERPETIWARASILESFEGKNTLYKKMVKALNMKTNWDRNVLNPQGGSPSERVYQDLIKKIKTGFFEKSRKFNLIKSNRFVREAYNAF